MDERKRKRVNSFDEEIFDQFYDFQSVVSAQGMTGLTPELPQSEEALENYSRLQGIPKKP